MKIALDEKEWEDGFCLSDQLLKEAIADHIFAVLPDLTDADNVVFLDRWEGTWSYLPTLKWVRVTKAGEVQTTSFPPKGKS
jgi:translation machinery-associated protein 16